MKASNAGSGWGRRAAAVALLAGAVAGCRDSGLPDRNLPKAEAEHRTYAYPAYQAAATAPVIWELGGRRWQAGGAYETIAPSMLRQVASAGGTAIYALTTDPEPYDRLFTPAGPNRWQVVESLD